jgi:hypothetical protein
MLKKNTAQKWWVYCIDSSDGKLASGQAANITASFYTPADVLTATSDVNPTEAGTTGYYFFNLTAGETNFNTVDIIANHSNSKYVVLPLHGERWTVDAFQSYELAAAIRAVGVGVRATQADDGTMSLYEGMTYNGTAHPKLSFTVSKNYSAATSITLSIYQPSNTTTAIKTASASAVSSTLIEVSTFAATFTPSLTYSGNPLTAELRYSLIASFSGSLETIATGPLFVYDTPPTS